MTRGKKTLAKGIFTALLLIVAAVVTPVGAQSRGPQARVDVIAEAIATSFYAYDMNAVASVIRTIVTDDSDVRGVELVDKHSESVVFETFREDDGQLRSGTPIPSNGYRRTARATCSSKSPTCAFLVSDSTGTPRSRSHSNTSASRQATAREPIGWFSGKSPRLTMA